MNAASIAFLTELNDLLKAHKAEMVVEDGKMVIWSYTQYDGEGNQVRDNIDINLGSWTDGE